MFPSKLPNMSLGSFYVIIDIHTHFVIVEILRFIYEVKPRSYERVFYFNRLDFDTVILNPSNSTGFLS